MDPTIKKLANNVVNYSCSVKKKEKVLIECFGNDPYPLVKDLIDETYRVGGIPYVSLKDYSILKNIISKCSSDQLKFMARNDLLKMKESDAHIIIRSYDNVSELSDTDSERMNLYTKYYIDAVTEERFKMKKWVILRYPNNSMAQLANQNLEAFEDFFFKVCNMDYNKMSKALDQLVELMNETDIVNIKGPGTELTFSIKDIPTVKCAGKLNIPDGEIFTAPIKNSVNGNITFNCPAIYQGVTYENIYFEFKNGKIMHATSNDTKRLNKVLDTDVGARFLGEFAFGVNPYILNPIKDLLFDEKILGSFHIALGKCYYETNNDNNSAIHWDITCIQTPEHGGGEIYFDNILIRKDGRFVIKKLEGLNPENLK